MTPRSEFHPSLGTPLCGSADALLIVNEFGVIESANAAAERLFLYEPRGLDRKEIECLIPESVRDRHAGFVASFFSDPKTRYLGSSDFTVLRSDGSEFRADILLFPLTRSGRQVVMVAVVDLTTNLATDESADEIRSILSRVESEEEPLSVDECRGIIQQVGDVSLQALSNAAGPRSSKDDFLLGYIAAEESNYQHRFSRLFETIPTPLWEADYSEVAVWFEKLREEGVESLGDYFDSDAGSLDRLIGMVRVKRRNAAAITAAIAPTADGSLDPEMMSSAMREIFREHSIGFYEGRTVMETTIHAGGSEAEEAMFVTMSWLVEDSVDQVGLSSVYSTVTDLRPFNRLENERRIALEQFEGVFNNAAAGITMLDSQGLLLRANRAFTEMLGYEAGELDGVHLSEITPIEDRGNLEEYIRPGTLDTQDVAVFERPYVCRDGDIAWGRVSIRSPDRGTDPEAPLVAVITDITTLREERHARAKAEADLEARNEELQLFAWTAAHDLSEPLRKIRVFGGRLADTAGDALDERSRDYLERMTSAADRMQDLIDGLHEYSRITTTGGEFTPVDLGEIARQVIADLEVTIAAAEATVEVGDLPRVEGDPFQLRQLIQNLISNSIKYRSSERPVFVSISGRYDGDWAEFSVADNGVGFEQEQAERIFGLFERLGEWGSLQGSGMGLAIVQKIVERHAGSISATSAPDQGATFTVRFPTSGSR
ncbi:MAG: ATP-binding protein [Acidimicrobiia bacterium]